MTSSPGSTLSFRTVSSTCCRVGPILTHRVTLGGGGGWLFPRHLRAQHRSRRNSPWRVRSQLGILIPIGVADKTAAEDLGIDPRSPEGHSLLMGGDLQAGWADSLSLGWLNRHDRWPWESVPGARKEDVLQHKCSGWRSHQCSAR